MQTLQVQLGSRSYPIFIGEGLLGRADLLQAHIPARTFAVVSNTTVAPLYLETLLEGLKPRIPIEVILPDGEAHKTLSTVARILDVMVANRLARDCAVLALGGGVVGDMAGFAASCYQRGVPYVQLPTTLLAQVDSSVGGKTGVNHPGGKNLIGAFHQPSAVLADTRTLGTLPPRELRAGLAEIIKYGLICDAGFFTWIDQNLEALLGGDTQALTHAIHRSCEIKARIVAADEHEHGERALLNLGHTFGHAIESATSYQKYLHGEAVGAGLLMAAALSHECNWLSLSELDRLQRLLERAGLPTHIPEVKGAAAHDHMQIDKKVRDGQLRLIVMRGIGQAFVTSEYPGRALQSTLSHYFG